MESLSLEQRELIKRTLTQLLLAIDHLQEWNADLKDTSEWTHSSEGMQKLAANCMLIEAIGEGIKNLDRRSNGKLLQLRPEIAWHEIMAMRNHIAHGYFEIDAEFIILVIKDDLPPLKEALQYLLERF